MILVPRDGIPRSAGSLPDIQRHRLRPVRLLRIWISEGLTQADS